GCFLLMFFENIDRTISYLSHKSFEFLNAK
ncbi:unnamed protein product, partial [marine sediment metagenome]